MSGQSLAIGRYAALSFCRADILLQVADDLTIKFCSGPTKPVFGRSAEDLVGTGLLSLVVPADRSILSDLLQVSSKGARIDDLILKAQSSPDKSFDIAISGYRVPDFNNDFFLAIKVSPKQTIPVGRRTEDRDEDTGVLNGDAFLDAATQRVKAVEAAGGKAKVSMVKIGDLADAGIEAGSAEETKALRAIGDVLSSQSIGGDTAGRIDDENFSLVHGEGVDPSTLSEKISNALTTVAPTAKSLMPSVATMDADSSGMDEQQLAKAMMYSLQKFTKTGDVPDGNLSEALEKSLEQNVKAIERFKKICSEGTFDLVFMPVCSLKEGTVHHFEALTRFREEAGESPFELITLAEEVGVISEFDLCVAERAIETLHRADLERSPTPVAINVSGHSISDSGFRKALHKLLASDSRLSQFLSLEITESAEITDLEGVNAAIQTFRALNFKVALDDFGAGAASFDYLNSFDVDTVKFDGPVVKRAAATRKGKAFLASMATLCREIEVETIAEMVEDQELSDFLKSCGIELGQGWHFGKPMSDKDAFPGIMPEKSKSESSWTTPAAERKDPSQSLLERLSSGDI